MANLATLASSFTNLEAQKKSIAVSVSELEALKESKVVGQLSFVVSKVHGDVTDVVNLGVTPSEANLSLSKLKNMSVGTPTELQVTTKDISISVSCSLSAADTQEGEASATVEYSADFDVKEIDDNESMSTELELSSSNNQTLKVHVSATYDTISGLLASKQVELKEVTQASAEVVKEIQRLQSQQQTKKTKKTKKSGSKQVVVEDSSAAFDVDSEEPSILTSTIASATEYGLAGLQMGMAHRAVVMFGVASWAILSMGEYASI